ncbi:unnamed protein product [Zymoseptoria tritici ST99CH_3D1]|nr:unnamed protein product [Zymoseptoria tritici ST99CH_3D1]
MSDEVKSKASRLEHYTGLAPDSGFMDPQQRSQASSEQDMATLETTASFSPDCQEDVDDPHPGNDRAFTLPAASKLIIAFALFALVVGIIWGGADRGWKPPTEAARRMQPDTDCARMLVNTIPAHDGSPLGTAELAQHLHRVGAVHQELLELVVHTDTVLLAQQRVGLFEMEAVVPWLIKMERIGLADKVMREKTRARLLASLVLPRFLLRGEAKSALSSSRSAAAA